MTMPKWLTQQDVKKSSLKQEKRLAKKNNGRVQAGSGMFFGDKGDVRYQFHLIEAKTTKKDSIVIKKQWLDKIRKEAIKDGRIPALALEIGGRNYYLLEACHLEG